jgi:hypothetical protein
MRYSSVPRNNNSLFNDDIPGSISFQFFLKFAGAKSKKNLASKKSDHYHEKLVDNQRSQNNFLLEQSIVKISPFTSR